MASSISGLASTLEPFHRVSDREHELDLIRTALALMATGGATRITVLGLRLEQGLVHEASILARDAGLRLQVTRDGPRGDMLLEASG